MAESYLCKGEFVHFSNGGAELLQEKWIEIGKKLENQEGLNEIVKTLEIENKKGQGIRAYGIDGSYEDFTSSKPLLRWLDINEILINELKKEGVNSRLFNGIGDRELVKSWIKRLSIISDAISNEHEKALKEYGK
jgi:hypothetical protein